MAAGTRDRSTQRATSSSAVAPAQPRRARVGRRRASGSPTGASWGGQERAREAGRASLCAAIPCHYTTGPGGWTTPAAPAAGRRTGAASSMGTPVTPGSHEAEERGPEAGPRAARAPPAAAGARGPATRSTPPAARACPSARAKSGVDPPRQLDRPRTRARRAPPARCARRGGGCAGASARTAPPRRAARSRRPRDGQPGEPRARLAQQRVPPWPVKQHARVRRRLAQLVRLDGASSGDDVGWGRRSSGVSHRAERRVVVHGRSSRSGMPSASAAMRGVRAAPRPASAARGAPCSRAAPSRRSPRRSVSGRARWRPARWSRARRSAGCRRGPAAAGRHRLAQHLHHLLHDVRAPASRRARSGSVGSCQ